MNINAAADVALGMRDTATTINDCFGEDGFINTDRYLEMMMDGGDTEDDFHAMLHDDTSDHDDEGPPPKKRRKKRIILARRAENGELEAILPTESLWYHMYIDCPQTTDSRFLKKFRRRFRHPYAQFNWFANEEIKENWFPKWKPNGTDAAGKNSSPLKLLILGAFRYIGRGLTFDDMEECTAISEEVHRVFFHHFIEVGSTILYERFVKAPRVEEDLQQHMHEFQRAGMNGAFASTDASGVLHEMCTMRTKRSHQGAKHKSAQRTYNTTVNHRRRILASTPGNPGSFNDKTLILFDEFIQDIKSGRILDDYTFELLEKREDGEIIAVKYKGVWLIVDNGYHKWSTTVPPHTRSVNRDEIRWSEWLESMRKDVECTFGILKGRWRILKTGVRLHSTESVDKVWLTCCALHNWLLEIDGLDQPWDGVNAATSAWTGDGEFAQLEVSETPMALQRILYPAEIRDYDTSTFGVIASEEDTANIIAGEEDTANANNEAVIDAADEQFRRVRDLSLDFFRSKLVEHFNILFDDRKIVWPKRRGPRPTTPPHSHS